MQCILSRSRRYILHMRIKNQFSSNVSIHSKNICDRTLPNFESSAFFSVFICFCIIYLILWYPYTYKDNNRYLLRRDTALVVLKDLAPILFFFAASFFHSEFYQKLVSLLYPWAEIHELSRYYYTLSTF